MAGTNESRDEKDSRSMGSHLSGGSNLTQKTAGEGKGKWFPQTSRRTYADLLALPNKDYLDETVVPILLEGMATLDRVRPDDPILFMASFLLRHKEQYDRTGVSATPSASPTSTKPNSPQVAKPASPKKAKPAMPKLAKVVDAAMAQK